MNEIVQQLVLAALALLGYCTGSIMGLYIYLRITERQHQRELEKLRERHKRYFPQSVYDPPVE